LTRKVFWAIRAFKVPLLYLAEPPFLVLPSDSEASLTSLGTASPRRPLGWRLGATKKRAPGDNARAYTKTFGDYSTYTTLLR